MSTNSDQRWIHYMHRHMRHQCCLVEKQKMLHCSQYSPESNIRSYVNEVGYIKQCVKQKNTGFANMSDDGEHLQYFWSGPAHPLTTLNA